MKKNKSKSKNHSTSKQLSKELESKFAAAISEIASQFGKVKKADKVISKFAKQLSKKISIVPVQDSIDPFIKEEPAAPAVAKEKVVKPAVKKTSTSKVKEVSE